MKGRVGREWLSPFLEILVADVTARFVSNRGCGRDVETPIASDFGHATILNIQIIIM